MMILSDGESRYELAYTNDGPVEPCSVSCHQITNGAYTTWYLRRGEVRVMCDGQELHARAGDLVLFDPYVTRSHEFSPEVSLVSVWFKVSSDGFDFFPPIHPPRQVQAGSLPHKEADAYVHAAVDLCAVEARRRTDSGASTAELEWEDRTKFARWLACWHRLRCALLPEGRGSLDPRVSTAMRMLEPKITAWKLRRDAVLAEAGISAVHFTRLFRQATGWTPQQWVEDRCFGIAQDMLRTKRYSIKQVAVELGFCDSSHFSKWFSRKAGSRPKVWRKGRGDGHVGADASR